MGDACISGSRRHRANVIGPAFHRARHGRENGAARTCHLPDRDPSRGPRRRHARFSDEYIEGRGLGGRTTRLANRREMMRAGPRAPSHRTCRRFEVVGEAVRNAHHKLRVAREKRTSARRLAHHAQGRHPRRGPWRDGHHPRQHGRGRLIHRGAARAMPISLCSSAPTARGRRA